MPYNIIKYFMVIGIHKEEIDTKNITKNYGTFIGEILNKELK